MGNGALKRAVNERHVFFAEAFRDKPGASQLDSRKCQRNGKSADAVNERGNANRLRAYLRGDNYLRADADGAKQHRNARQKQRLPQKMPFVLHVFPPIAPILSKIYGILKECRTVSMTNREAFVNCDGLHKIICEENYEKFS